MLKGDMIFFDVTGKVLDVELEAVVVVVVSIFSTGTS